MTLTIGRVASVVKVSTDTLRYYEREGLIAPTSKSRGGYRPYDRDVANKHNTVASPAHPILCAVSKSNFVGSALVRRYHQVVSSSRQAYQFKQ